MAEAPRIVIVTSCTGEKAVSHEKAPTLDDFQKGDARIAQFEKRLAGLLTPARDLYSGMQHVRLMRGIEALKSARKSDKMLPEVDLFVLSAGYGLVPGNKRLLPYEATFTGMGKRDLRDWADALKIPASIRRVLRKPYDLALILLGDSYLEACQLDDAVQLGGTALFLCGKTTEKKLPKLPRLKAVVLSSADTKRFSCGLVGLKGEVAARILERMANGSIRLSDLLGGGGALLDLLDTASSSPKRAKRAARANPDVDRVVELPESWRNKSHRQKLAYFIPDWDDQVDPDFDFETETHSGGTGDWSNQVYAHQMFKEPNYDGILISKVVAEQSKKKAERINRLGVHRHMRLPRDFPIMGDCGAFGYIKEYEPPYTTSEILDYYTRLDFDFGVSIDHFAIGEEADRKRRYELTIQNARDFIVEHKKLGLNWTPIGAVQGWDEKSFAKAARQYAQMGYKYIALGAMVRRRTPEILSIVEAVREVIPSEMKVHLFGVARLNAIQEFVKAGVNSADSASWLRRAWMGSSGNNYLSIDGHEFAAIRIPEAEKSFRAKRMVSEGRATLDQVRKLERACIEAMHAYDRGKRTVDQVLDTLHEYDQLITPERQDHRAFLRRTLEEMPWKTCPCDICRTSGIDVVIFRGNNRNRRRGFHNTYAFYQLFQRLLAGEEVPALTLDRRTTQMDLVLTDEEAD